MALMALYRVHEEPDGIMHREVVERQQGGDGHQQIMMLEKHLKKYPQSGRDEKDGPWAIDADGRRYTFNCVVM